MNEPQAELVTVFRSLDRAADEEADRVRMLLADAGLSPVVLDDQAMGVIEGTWEVRVPAGQAAQAEQLIAAEGDGEGGPDQPVVDGSPELELEAVFHSEGSTTAEMEATEIQMLLTAEGMETVIIGTPTLPNLPFEVRVPKADAERARQLIADAQTAGPAAAEEASREEGSGGAPPE